MEYGQRQELQSADASERTTRMMRSVREILAEQGQEHLLDADNFEAASAAPTARCLVRQPLHAPRKKVVFSAHRTCVAR